MHQGTCSSSTFGTRMSAGRSRLECIFISPSSTLSTVGLAPSLPKDHDAFLKTPSLLITQLATTAARRPVKFGSNFHARGNGLRKCHGRRASAWRGSTHRARRKTSEGAHDLMSVSEETAPAAPRRHSGQTPAARGGGTQTFAAADCMPVLVHFRVRSSGREFDQQLLFASPLTLAISRLGARTRASFLSTPSSHHPSLLSLAPAWPLDSTATVCLPLATLDLALRTVPRSHPRCCPRPRRLPHL